VLCYLTCILAALVMSCDMAKRARALISVSLSWFSIDVRPACAIVASPGDVWSAPVIDMTACRCMASRLLVSRARP
jgi:hypothetical protein